MATIIFRYEAATVWLDGATMAGTVNEIELPELSWDETDHETIALIGTPQFASKLEPMECTITWVGYSPELAAAAANPYRNVNLQVRGNFGEYYASGKNADKLLKLDLSGRFMSNGIGTFSPGEFERESMMSVDFVKETWSGQEVLTVGINPPIYRVRGNDLLANYRANLGL